MIMLIIIIFVVSRRRHQGGGVAEWSMHCTRDQNVVGSNLLEATFSPSLVSGWWAQYLVLRIPKNRDTDLKFQDRLEVNHVVHMVELFLMLQALLDDDSAAEHLLHCASSCPETCLFFCQQFFCLFVQDDSQHDIRQSVA